MKDGYSDSHEYDDIIGCPHHVSLKRRGMSLHDRAAQFAPFAALTGYDDCINEAHRLTDRKSEPDEETVLRINETLGMLLADHTAHPLVSLTYFVRDKYKSGGSYIEKTGNIKQLDEFNRTLVFYDGSVVPIDDLYDLIAYPCAV